MKEFNHFKQKFTKFNYENKCLYKNNVDKTIFVVLLDLQLFLETPFWSSKSVHS